MPKLAILALLPMTSPLSFFCSVSLLSAHLLLFSAAVAFFLLLLTGSVRPYPALPLLGKLCPLYCVLLTGHFVFRQNT